jgi:hypothetical protein
MKHVANMPTVIEDVMGCMLRYVATLLTRAWRLLLRLFGNPQMYDDTDPTKTGFSDIDPFYDSTDRRNDSFRDRDQFWKR